jgi:hypothetical protein
MMDKTEADQVAETLRGAVEMIARVLVGLPPFED